MIPTETGERRAGWKTQLLDRLHDPLQLRIVLLGVMLVAAYFAVYVPLTAQIADQSAQVRRERRMAELATTIEQFETQFRKFEKRVPKQADTKEWMQYVLDGIHRYPLKLTKLDCPGSKRMGPYEAVVLKVEVEGSLYDLDRFLHWIETNARLLRVDDIAIAVAKSTAPMRRKSSKETAQDAENEKDELVMKLTVIGLAG